MTLGLCESFLSSVYKGEFGYLVYSVCCVFLRRKKREKNGYLYGSSFYSALLRLGL